MTYESFLKALHARGMFRIRPSLDRIRKVLHVLDDPQDKFSSVHIAGTNGKGSVAAGLESVLRASGYRTALYTSPHLIDLRERIQIGGLPLLDGFLPIAEEVLAAEKEAKTSLTYFELVTAIAFQSFAKSKVQIAVIECGLGGLWDATNMMKNPLVSLITSVGLDHTQWLGQNEYEIATQKAGIIKQNGTVVSGVRGQGRSTIVMAARAKKASLAQLDIDFTAQGLTSSWVTGKQTLQFRYRQEPPETIPFGLLGSHQVDNAALIMAALRELKLKGWRIPTAKRDQGLHDVYWPGRLQLLPSPKTAHILLDGAHNPPAVNQLLQSIEDSIFKNVPKTFVFSAYKDKDYLTMARMITRLAAEVCLCPLEGSRRAEISKLRAAFSQVSGPVRTFKSPQEALSNALKDTPRDGLVVVTGSLSLVAHILRDWSMPKIKYSASKMLSRA